MGENALPVEIREDTGKGVARKLRAAGRIPAVLYGHGKESIALSIDPKPLERLLATAGANALIDLEGAGPVAGRTVLVKDLQREPVRGAAMHADLYEIDRTEKIHVSIPVHITGTPAGVKLGGGLLDSVLRELEVECLPGKIPESVDVDVSALEIGESIHVSDVSLGQDVEMITHGELPIVSVIAPAAAEEEPVAEEGEEAVEGAEAAAPAEGDDAAKSDAS